MLADVDAGSKKRLFELAGELFQATDGADAAEVFDSLFSREKLGSTALGYGIAIPHGRIKGLKDIGLRPLGAGLVAAVLVGGVSIALISVLY